MDYDCEAEEKEPRMSLYSVLKRRGHALMDEIVELGIERNDIYDEMAIRLNKPRGTANFSKIRSLSVLDAAIKHLEDLKRELVDK